MLDLKRLMALREVARLESFSAAAVELSLTQSAVSQQVASLEQQLGIRLLDRSPVIALTPAGELLVEHGGHALDHLAAAEAELAAFRGLRAGRLRVGAFASAASGLLPDVLRRFRALQPEVQIALRQLETEASLEALRRGEIDLAITFRYSIAPPREPARAMREWVLFDEDLFIALPASHPRAGQDGVWLDELAGDAWIEALQAGVPLGLLSGGSTTKGFRPGVLFEGDDFGAVLGLVSAESAVAVVPQLAIRDVPDDVVLLPVAPEPLVRTLSVVTLATGRVAPATGAMVDLLIERGRELTAERTRAARRRALHQRS
jgi:DNA-binding transcriptional LysR family regulator